MAIIMKLFYFLWMIVGFAAIVLVLQTIIDSVRKGKIKVWLDKKSEWRNKRKLDKDTSKKQIKNHNKKKDGINYEALKFEYNEICTIVNTAASELNVSNYSEVYILKFDEYAKKKVLYNNKFSGTYSLDRLACLVKALIEEPIVKKSDNGVTNFAVVDKVIEIFSKKDISYCDYPIFDCYDKENMFLKMQDDYRLYSDDIFLVAMYIIEKIYK